MFDHKAYDKAYYQKNKAVIQQRRKKVRDSKFAWVRQYKTDSTCLRCGFEDYRALHFHHRDPTTKVMTIANALRDGWSDERLMTEIEKCDVLCANCHSIETFRGVA